MTRVFVCTCICVALFILYQRCFYSRSLTFFFSQRDVARTVRTQARNFLAHVSPKIVSNQAFREGMDMMRECARILQNHRIDPTLYDHTAVMDELERIPGGFSQYSL